MKSVSISPVPTAPCILLFIDNLLGLFPFRQWATLRARVAFCLLLCPHIFQHLHHNRCSLSVCWMMPGWMYGPSKPGAEGALENGPYQSLERNHWGSQEKKMASETHDNIIWHLGSALVFLSWVFVRNCVLSAIGHAEKVEMHKEVHRVWGEDSQIPSRSKVLRKLLATLKHIIRTIDRGTGMNSQRGT